MKIDEKIRGRIEDGLLKLIVEHEPNFHRLGQETKLVDCEDVGVSFEPRLKLRYEVSFKGKKYGIYEQTLVFTQNLQEVVARVEANWVEHS
ncbi:MAG: hypothetical protein AABX54_05015 [Nanoarchaeota archaeon]